MPPPTGEPAKEKSLRDVVEELDRYPIDAFLFLQQGLSYAVEKVHGPAPANQPHANRHISGQELCDALRDYALTRWGMMARTVLRRWNITSTLDFGQIVFAMVESGLMQKTPQDSLEDFRDVYDFRSAFESAYRIPLDQPTEGRP